MEYRTFAKDPSMKISAVGLGVGDMSELPKEDVVAILEKAFAHGINFYDTSTSFNKVHLAHGEFFKKHRDQVYIQMHFGQVYDENGEYARDYDDLQRIKDTFEFQCKTLNTDYADFGYIHCIDDMPTIDKILTNGVWDYMKELKAQGRIRHLGISTHTVEIAHRMLDTGDVDFFMFSINPAYDFEDADDDMHDGSASDRLALYERAAAMGVGISVMKPYAGGQLLQDSTSPIGKALTRTQCIQYCLDKPGVCTVVPGNRNMEDLDDMLKYLEASDEEKDYSVISSLAKADIKGKCVYCHHCMPCPAGLQIHTINKYYDLAKAGDRMAIDHYRNLELHASDCIKCGTCNERCPFSVDQANHMTEIAEYFGF